MIGATLTTRLAQDGIDKRTITAFAFALPRLQPQGVLGLDRGRRADPAARPPRPARLLAAARGARRDRGGRQPRARRSRGEHPRDRRRGVLVGIAGATYDIVIDAYRIETLKPEPARRRLGHVAVRLAHRIGGRRGARARRRGAHGLGRGLPRLRRVRAAGDDHRPRSSASRRGTSSIDAKRGLSAVWALDRRAVRRVPASLRAPGSCCCSSSCTRSATRWRT